MATLVLLSFSNTAKLLPKSSILDPIRLSPLKTAPPSRPFFTKPTPTPPSPPSSVPLVFIPGMKGTHLSSPQSRHWLTLPNLLDIVPPSSLSSSQHSIDLPLTYTRFSSSDDIKKYVQDRGPLTPDGVIRSVLELVPGKMSFFPFYGHAVDFLSQIDRPTAVFDYDWRRNLFDLSDELHSFVLNKFGEGREVQIVAHSLGGLLAYRVMKDYPEVYGVGGVVVGVPFGTGTQYLEDVHRGYFTESKRCRQFLPPTQFSFSSHWSFFPSERETDGLVDVGADDTETFDTESSAVGDTGPDFRGPATGGRPVEVDFYDVADWERLELGVFDPFYSEGLGEEKMEAYRSHLRIQLERAQTWRKEVLGDDDELTTEQRETTTNSMPPLVVCASDSVPTVTQILRRRRDGSSSTSTGASSSGEEPQSVWEYDYVSGRTSPGDGRVDFDNAFPPAGGHFKKISLDSRHSKQMCWEAEGGSWGRVWDEVVAQVLVHERKE